MSRFLPLLSHRRFTEKTAMSPYYTPPSFKRRCPLSCALISPAWHLVRLITLTSAKRFILVNPFARPLRHVADILRDPLSSDRADLEYTLSTLSLSDGVLFLRHGCVTSLPRPCQIVHATRTFAMFTRSVIINSPTFLHPARNPNCS